MAIEEGWGDDLTTPLETMPGPSNPWAAKSGGGRPTGGGVGKPVPDFRPPRPDEGGFGDVVIDGDHMVGGHVMQGLGVLAIAGGMLSVGIAAGAAAAGAATPVGWVVVGVGLTVIGVGLLVAGTATEIGGIDPPVNDWRERVRPVAARRWRVPVWMSAEEAELLRAGWEIERLSQGQFDLIDRARTAAAEKDDKVYAMHLEDLFQVQSLMERHAAKLADGLEAMIKAHADVIASEPLPKAADIRDLSMNLPAERALLADMGVGSGDLVLAMAAMRGLGDRQQAFQDFVTARLDKAGGDLGTLVSGLAEDLRGRDYVDWRAFRE